MTMETRVAMDISDPTAGTDTADGLVVGRVTADAVARDIAAATRRVLHATRVAWTLARQVAPDRDANLVAVRMQIRQAGGSRRILAGLARETADGLINIRATIIDADTIRRRADALIRVGRSRLADAERGVTVAAAAAALEVIEALRRLHVPLTELDQALDEARCCSGVIDASLTLRLHAAAMVAIETQVDQVAARLQNLRAEVEAVHAVALAPDATITACRGALDAIGAGTLPLPRVIWPKWSSAQSKHAKGGWVGDMFAAPELEQPDAEEDGGLISVRGQLRAREGPGQSPEC
jgi:hypothetical protein